MIAVILSPLYIYLNLYMAKMFFKWTTLCSKYFKNKILRKVIIIIHFIFASSIVIGFILPNSKIKRIFTLMGNYYLGVTLYALMTILFVDLIRIIIEKIKVKSNKSKVTKLVIKLKNLIQNRKVKVVTGLLCTILVITVTILGTLHARVIKVTRYNINIDKEANIEKLKIALIADLHLGYNIGTFQMKQMVEKINKENVDIILIAGDIFDNSYESLDDPNKLISLLKSMKSNYGTYAIYGNHDVIERSIAGFTFNIHNNLKNDTSILDEMLKKANINILSDEGFILEDSIYIFGRIDYSVVYREIYKSRKTAKDITSKIDKDMPIIVLDHEPNDIDKLSEAGVDLTLSGHTHDGQVFPGNILVDIAYENPYGYLKKGNMHSIVTSGVGLYGPNMRVASDAEIAIINVNFK